MNTKQNLEFNPKLMALWKREINKWPEGSIEYKAYEANIAKYSDGD